MQGKKNHTAISISRENYEKIVKMGDMTKSFNDIVTDLLKNAQPMGASAGAATTKVTGKEK